MKQLQASVGKVASTFLTCQLPTGGGRLPEAMIGNGAFQSRFSHISVTCLIEM